MAFWLGIASADHARAGREGGFAQLGHGRHMALNGIGAGDWIVYYAPREGMGTGAPVQAFVTIGEVTSPAPYRAEQTMDFLPYRLDVRYLDAQAAPIRPLLEALELTRGRGPHWGMALRGPKRRLATADFRRIAEEMGVGALTPPG
ncbi:EVE domain-containing protein [Pseudoroseicyclus sp. CXY001]|uniref:EVE domain-containing protein n=1 Tax=Pseudoroseicyclus sp. CXY001 TaxID=3242492 RepID=UPI00358DB0E3